MARSSGEISGELFQRYRGNPLLSPERWPYAANAVMNAGAAEVDGSTVLLCRVEDRRGISHLTVAKSRNGVSNWVVDDVPLLAPDPDLRHEAWGLEDPRLTWIEDLGSWVIAFTSFGPGGPGLSLATTQDFRSVQRLGMVDSALTEALIEAWKYTGDREYAHRAVWAFEWFLGRNTHGLPVYDDLSGGCHDGLGPAGLNPNEGAESTLAYLQALLALESAGLQSCITRPE